MRSIFFSSVAHELRTPLNSIIPMIKMMLETMSDILDSRAIKYLRIVLNSAKHLENIIEDALDMSRLENNNFTLFKEMCNIREAVQDVCNIMDF